MAAPLEQTQRELTRRLGAVARLLAAEQAKELSRSRRSQSRASKAIAVTVAAVPDGFRVAQSSASEPGQPTLSETALRIMGRLAGVVRRG